MLQLILIAVSTGIVSRRAKTNGHNPVLFGILTVLAALVCASVGGYYFGLAGDLLGAFVGALVMEEVVRNMPKKPQEKKQVFCPQCGMKQDWDENKVCERCKSPLRR